MSFVINQQSINYCLSTSFELIKMNLNEKTTSNEIKKSFFLILN